jgi:putative methanogenesis marker protein 5
MGCARTDELVEFLVKQKKIPILELDYPADEEEGIIFVRRVKEFLTGLGGSS